MIYSIDKMLNIIPSKYQLVYVAAKRAEAMEQTKFYQMEENEYKSIIKWEKLTKIPFVRGVFNFVDSLVLGMKTLTYSASFLEEETEILLT